MKSVSDSTSSNAIKRVFSRLFPNNGPPQPPIPETPIPETPIPQEILAFRTITKLLSLIQQERAIQGTETIPADNQRRRELQIINALATVAVTGFQVVAVANNLDSSRLDPNASKLTLLAVVKPSNDEKQCITPSKKSSWRVTLTQNQREIDPPLNLTGQPTIASVESLAGLKFADDKAIKKRVENCW
jgi:hypothetical protein